MNKGKFLSLILRHRPDVIGMTLDEHGYAHVDELIEKMNTQTPMDRETLEEIVRTDDKQRFSFNADHTLIRANQGHSIPVDVELMEKRPPDVLYHGTSTKAAPLIEASAILPMTRLYVHLSWDVKTAIKVGLRHGQVVVYKIDAKKMYEDGYRFYLSKNNVWLTKKVPVSYIQKIPAE